MTPAVRCAISALAVVAAAGAGCSRPDTDIVSTNTEDVGNYTVSGERDGDALRVSVCVDNPRRAQSVADRVLRQLYSKGLGVITLDVYGAQHGITRLVWRSGVRTGEPLSGPAPQGLCGRGDVKEHS